MNLDFESLKNEFIKVLENTKTVVFATSLNNRVQARAVSIINFNEIIYFQTDSLFEKYKQINENPNVALNFFNVSIEGKAKSIGNIYKNKLDFFKEKYSLIHPDSFKTYGNIKTQIVIEITPVFITFWKYENNIPVRDFLDITRKIAWREVYKLN